MKQKITILLVGFLLTLGISSCVKDSAPELGDRGNTIVKFNEGPRKDFYYAPFPTGSKTVTITFTRDVNSNTALNKPVEVVLLEDPTLVPAGYTELPTANFTYTGSDAGVILTSGKITAIRFAAGEVSKKIKMNLIGSAWTNVGISYAKAYKVTDAGGNGNSVAADNGKMIVTFGIINKYDGVYEVTGTMVDLNGTRIAKGYPKTVELRTTGLTQVEVYDRYVLGKFGSYPLYIYTAADNGDRYAFGLGFNFNSSDAITSVFDGMYWEDFEFILGSGASNTYSSGVIKVQWKTDANISGFPIGRFTVTETYTYKGSRF